MRWLSVVMVTGGCAGGTIVVDGEPVEGGPCLPGLAAACEDPTKPDPGPDGTVLVPEDPGSGDGVGAYFVDADASGDRTNDLDGTSTDTEFTVVLADEQGLPLTGIAVTIETVAYGDVVLTEGVPGTYGGDLDAYTPGYTLHVDGPAGEFWATAIGPAVHAIALPPEPIDVSELVTVTWAPGGMPSAHLDTRGTGGFDTEDDGTQTFEAGALDEDDEFGEERIRIRRGDSLELTGALPGSTFDISIRVTEDDVDTVDLGG